MSTNPTKRPKMEGSLRSSSSAASRLLPTTTATSSTSASSVKVEGGGPELTAADERVLAYVGKHPRCDGESIIIGTGCDSTQIAQVINKLTSLGRLVIFQGASNQATFEVGTDLTQKIASLPQDERILYQVIETSHNKGISHRQLRHKTNMEQTRIQHAIKQLRSKSLIREFFPVSSKKKHYMIVGLTPDAAVDGGIFFDEKNEFDHPLVNTLRDAAVRFLKRKYADAIKQKPSPLELYKRAYGSVEEYVNLILSNNITQELSIADATNIFQSLVDDKTVIPHADKTKKEFRLSHMQQQPMGLTSVPCGRCPVRKKCSPAGVINPVDCEYMQKWLDLSF